MSVSGPAGAELDSLLALACRAAAQAGKRLARRPPRPKELACSGRRDVKLSADRSSERLLLSILGRGARLPILGEESGRHGKFRPDGLRWLIDPLDGSLNYLRGIPVCCVSIGLWRGEQPLLGVVHDFFRGETFAGAVGRGARLNGRKIRAGGAGRRKDAVLCTGFPAGGDFRRRALLPFLDRLQEYKKVRLLGSAALSLAYVACGRADAYEERGIRSWDIAAGAALVLAAGGRIELRRGEKLDSYSVFASNGRF